jgi:hypothetical protein
MKKKLKKIQENLKNNPEFQAKLEEIKPKRNFFGFLFVVLFFFVPEVINYLWGLELNAWIVNLVQNAPENILSDALIWLSKESFDGQVSFVNIGLGIALLYWVYRK